MKCRELPTCKMFSTSFHTGTAYGTISITLVVNVFLTSHISSSLPYLQGSQYKLDCIF
jgi:hypothetical protein